MRFVAGRGADKACCWQRRCGEAVAGRGPSAQRTAGRDAAAKSHREASKERAPAASRKEHPALQANKKESGKTHSLLSPL